MTHFLTQRCTQMQYGADLFALNKDKRKPSDVATWCQHDGVAKHLNRLAYFTDRAQEKGHADFSFRVWDPNADTDCRPSEAGPVVDMGKDIQNILGLAGQNSTEHLKC